jgi:hypothetical protein
MKGAFLCINNGSLRLEVCLEQETPVPPEKKEREKERMCLCPPSLTMTFSPRIETKFKMLFLYFHH